MDVIQVLYCFVIIVQQKVSVATGKLPQRILNIIYQVIKFISHTCKPLEYFLTINLGTLSVIILHSSIYFSVDTSVLILEIDTTLP